MHESEQESNVHGPYAVKCMGHCDCVGAVSWLEDGRREDFWVVQAGPEIFLICVSDCTCTCACDMHMHM